MSVLLISQTFFLGNIAIHYCKISRNVANAEAYSGPCQISMIELLAKIVTSFNC